MAVSLSDDERSSDGAALAAVGRRKAFADVLSTINEKPVEVSETLLDFASASSGDRDAPSREAAGGASSSVHVRGSRPLPPVFWSAPVREAAGAEFLALLTSSSFGATLRAFNRRRR